LASSWPPQITPTWDARRRPTCAPQAAGALCNTFGFVGTGGAATACATSTTKAHDAFSRIYGLDEYREQGSASDKLRESLQARVDSMANKYNPAISEGERRPLVDDMIKIVEPEAQP
jgi:hypothetical protein